MINYCFLFNHILKGRLKKKNNKYGSMVKHMHCSDLKDTQGNDMHTRMLPILENFL